MRTISLLQLIKPILFKDRWTDQVRNLEDWGESEKGLLFSDHLRDFFIPWSGICSVTYDHEKPVAEKIKAAIPTEPIKPKKKAKNG